MKSQRVQHTLCWLVCECAGAAAAAVEGGVVCLATPVCSAVTVTDLAELCARGVSDAVSAAVTVVVVVVSSFVVSSALAGFVVVSSSLSAGRSVPVGCAVDVMPAAGLGTDWGRLQLASQNESNLSPS